LLSLSLSFLSRFLLSSSGGGGRRVKGGRRRCKRGGGGRRVAAAGGDGAAAAATGGSIGGDGRALPSARFGGRGGSSGERRLPSARSSRRGDGGLPWPLRRALHGRGGSRLPHPAASFPTTATAGSPQQQRQAPHGGGAFE
ncbi:Os11g0481500, partial [Oryza sativa Japonica Group]